MKLKIEYLAEVKEVEISQFESIDMLKQIVERVLSIPRDELSFTYSDRSLNSTVKPLEDLGIKEGDVIVVKRMHKVKGKTGMNDLTSISKNPMFKSLLKNPATLKSIKSMLPNMKDENEDSALNDLINMPGFEDELQRFAEDENYMSTQMRNADITMAKLENLPEGIKLMSSLAKDSRNLSNMQFARIDLKAGDVITAKNNSTIPGKNRTNYLVEYRRQLSELKSIGFDDVYENIAILKSVGGDLDRAIEKLCQKNSSSG